MGLIFKKPHLLKVSFLCVVFFALIGPCAYAQSNIDIPQSPAKPKPKPAISIKLAAEKAGERVYYTPSEWSKLSSLERVEVNKIGLLIGQGNNAFLVSLFDNMGWPGSSNRTDPFQVAKDKTGGQLPTNAQMRIIKNHRESVSNALVTFGGQGISGDYWCSDGSIISIWRDNPYPGSAAHFRIVTADIENGFKEVIVTKGENEEYDFIGPELSFWEKGRGFLRPVGLRGKYGFINEEGEIVIPLIFDGVDGCSPSETSDNYNWSGKGLMSVCINSQWGFINHKGEIVVPTIYDIVESRCNPAAIIEKEGLQGIINENGNHLLPIEFDEIEGDCYAKDIFFVKKKGKYGFINSNYKEVIPFKYDFVTGFYSSFNRNDRGLCGVGIDGKYGYIDKNGIEVIPLTFEFAESFHNNLAGIVLNNKLGFIDTKGVIVIPPQYYVDKEGLRIFYGTFANTRQHVVGSFEYSPYIALVKTATNRYIVINNKGEVISEYVYERMLQSGTDGFTLERDGRRVYLDIAGIEYDSEEARASNKIHAWEVLANHGFGDYQYKLGDTFRLKRDYTNAYKWYYKASQNGSVEALMQLGNLYYVDDGLEKSYSKAVEWYERFLAKANDTPSRVTDVDKSDVYQYMGRIYYKGGYGVESSYSKAFEYFEKSSTDESMYFLGWMYEHGQGTDQDKDKAIEFYQKSNGYGDSKERIDKLQSATGGSINGHEWVDLGLSVKWATCNVGASSPSEYGNYYAWGETSTKSEYSWESYKFRTSGDKYDNVKFRKYNTMHKYGRVDKKTRLDYSDDAARVNWGGLWRMPTDAEWTELRDNCTWTWTIQGGHNGYKVTSTKNGNSIFLPAAGLEHDHDDSNGVYWSSSVYTLPYRARNIYFNSSMAFGDEFYRYFGSSVRPVLNND